MITITPISITMNIEEKIAKLETDIKLKKNMLNVEITSQADNLIFKSTLIEQIRHMEQEASLLKQVRDSEKD
jgi:hypothetical protein